MNGKIKRISVIILAILFTMNLAGCSSENRVKENDIKVKESTVVVETTAGDPGTESGKEETDSSVAETEAGDDLTIMIQVPELPGNKMILMQGRNLNL